MPVPFADLPAAVTDMSAIELGAAIRGRRVSCREVMDAYLDRIAAVNPTVNAIVSLRDPDALCREAGERDAEIARGLWRGPLMGFPQAPKDLTATAGIPTTQGSPILAGFVPETDAIVVERARRAGAILIGKTNTPEFGLGSHTCNRLFGTTANPWAPGLSAGGSSGGAAVALATRMLPVADGSDMMGSLRNPAGWNNVVGLRPSFGRVPTGPAAEVFLQQLATDGPMGRTVADTALLLSVQAGHDPRAPLSLADDPAVFAGPLERDWTGARIGWLGDLGGQVALEPGVEEVCRRALGHFEALGCIVEEVAPEFDMEALWDAWVVLRGVLVAGAARPHHADPARRAELKPELVWEIEKGLALTGPAIFAASVTRSAWYQELRRLFARHDFLVLPSAQLFPFDAALPWPDRIGDRAMDSYHRWMEVMIPGTLGGGPVLAVPAGFDGRGRPIGLQIHGPARADLATLQVGAAYEAASGFSRLRPPAAG
ncbi:MAG TPA: amidase [Amaricoccus sp.]|nr:amidase [Amaricoccus sp.]